MKVVLRDIPKRIVTKPVKTEGIISYDVDNAYPQKVMRMVGASGTARNCVNLYSKFMAGMGFKDSVSGDAIINRKGDTADLLLGENVAPDFAHFGGFAVHVNYNLAFQKTSITAIPFEHVRLALPEKDDYGKITHVALYKDWGKEFHRRIKQTDVKKVHLFDDDPEIIAAQIEAAQGIKNYKGQVFWYSNRGQGYPIPIYDPVLEDIDTDAQLKIYRNSNVRTGFSASHIFLHKGKFESDAAREDFNQLIADFQGADVAGSIMVIEIEDDEQKPELIEVKSQVNDKVVNITNRNTKDNIIESFGAPSILVNADQGSGVTFSNELLKLSYDFYNSITAPERKILERQLVRLFDNFHEPLGSFEIEPLQWTITTSTPAE